VIQSGRDKEAALDERYKAHCDAAAAGETHPGLVAAEPREPSPHLVATAFPNQNLGAYPECQVHEPPWVRPPPRVPRVAPAGAPSPVSDTEGSGVVSIPSEVSRRLSQFCSLCGCCVVC